MKNRNEQFALQDQIENVAPIILANDQKIFIMHSARHQEPAVLSRQTFMQACPLSVIDKESLELIEVLRLHEAIDHTESSTGSAILLRSLIHPGTDLQYIRSRQESLREIASNDTLRAALKDCVREFGKSENALYKFFNKGLYALFPYPDLKKAKKSAVNISRMIPTIPRAETPYLQTLMSNLHAYRESSVDQMMNGSVYRTFKGLKSHKEVGFFTPKQKFVPRRLSKWLLAGPAIAAAPHALAASGFEPSLSPLLLPIGLAWTGIYAFYGLFIKPVRDTGNFIEPFRTRCINDKAFGRTIDAFGMIDALLSCCQFAAEWPQAAALPMVTDEDHHFFEATNLKNPVIANDNPDFVPNNVHMRGVHLTFISGPNSGGKTTICKSIVQNQLLAQMGSYVLAEKAAINIADRVRYQAPKFDGLEDEEGRFGTELGRTRDIFYATGPKSLVILDELAEGTTDEERLHESSAILNDFDTIGNNTVLVTHNHSLVDRFKGEKKGQYLKAEFDGDRPTYRIIPGISRVSHADRIAKKIHFSKEDRHQYMKAKGYL